MIPIGDFREESNGGAFSSPREKWVQEVKIVKMYYSRGYPECSQIKSFLFRMGEGERKNTLKNWLYQSNDVRILAAGCGDGEFLSHVFDTPIRYLRLEDLVYGNIERAQRNLMNEAETVESRVDDVFCSSDKGKYDFVLAVGIFDYYSDWAPLLNRLLARTEGSLIIDFPKSHTIHSFVRRIWLGMHHIKLHTTNQANLIHLLESMGLKSEIKELSLNWMVRIEK